MHKTESVCKRYKLLVKDRKYLHNIKTVFNKTETLCENRTFFSNCKRENIYTRILVKSRKYLHKTEPVYKKNINYL